MGNLPFWATFSTLLVMVIFSFIICFKKRDKSSYWFCIGLTTLFLIVFLSNHPVANKITSQWLSVEPRINQIEQSQEELKKIVSSLIKIQIISSDRAVVMGQTKLHKQLLDANIESLGQYLDKNELEKLQTELDEAAKSRKQ